MTIEYTRKTVSAEVVAVLRAHFGPDMKVFSSYSNPDGNDGLSSRPCMETEWGYVHAPIPMCGALTAWEKGEQPHERVNEETTWWLCIPTHCDECA
jgi:hypothetical protein